MSADAIKKYEQDNPHRHELMFYKTIIVGRGNSEKAAKQDAMRQLKLLKIKGPVEHFVRRPRDAIPNSEKTARKWYKTRAHRPVYWHSAVKMLIEKIGVSGVAKALGITSLKVINWKNKLSVPSDVHKDLLCPLIAKHLTKMQMDRCNLQVGE